MTHEPGKAQYMRARRSHDKKPGDMTKLQNKRHEHKQDPKPTLTLGPQLKSCLNFPLRSIKCKCLTLMSNLWNLTLKCHLKTSILCH